MRPRIFEKEHYDPRRRSEDGTKGEFAATQKNGPVLGVLLTLSAGTNHFVADIR
jgi:hypothetical protein